MKQNCLNFYYFTQLKNNSEKCHVSIIYLVKGGGTMLIQFSEITHVFFSVLQINPNSQAHRKWHMRLHISIGSCSQVLSQPPQFVYFIFAGHLGTKSNVLKVVNDVKHKTFFMKSRKLFYVHCLNKYSYSKNKQLFHTFSL